LPPFEINYEKALLTRVSHPNYRLKESATLYRRRLVHNACKVELKGESMRKNELLLTGKQNL